MNSKDYRDINVNVNLPAMIDAKHLFGMYSYISMLSSAWTQHPSRAIMFLCRRFGMDSISVLNSCGPWNEDASCLLTAISTPLESLP